MSENLNARCKHDQFPFLCDTCEITKLQSQLAESESLRSVQWPIVVASKFNVHRVSC